MSSSPCDEEQTQTIFQEDGTTSEEPLRKAADPVVDCFYIYPTVATEPAGNVSDFSNVSDILRPLRGQAVPLSVLCEIYAPLYHQATGASYIDPNGDEYLDTAYEDVAAAFELYLSRFNAGRLFLLVGHSQGAHMLRRLIQRRVESDSEVLSRLVAALPIGAVGDIVTPVGATTGGTFQVMELCTTREQVGCIMTYDSVAAELAGTATEPNPGATSEIACTNPAALGSNVSRPLAGSSFLATALQGGTYAGLSTTFATFPNLFSAACARGSSGRMGLQVSLNPDDQRESPLDLATADLHPFDFGFTRGDLLDVLAAKIEAM